MRDREIGEEGSPRKIPVPAHPVERRSPLPWQRPKPVEEDPEAPARTAAILRSPSYREAERDAEFLQRDDLRGLRLQLEYLKPELLLTEQGIEHTIVVVGSTRLLEPAAASRRVHDRQARLSADPENPELMRALAVAKRIQANSRYYEVAREFGRLVGTEAAAHWKAVVMTGGGPGIMEAANRGAFDAGAKSVGLNITLPHEQFPNPYVTPELCFSFHYFALRKLHFLHRARALVAFPGGYGTFDELFEALALIQTRKVQPIPVVLVGEAYWRRAFDVEFLVAEGAIDEEDRELFWYAETAREIWDGIRHWHAASGSAG